MKLREIFEQSLKDNVSVIAKRIDGWSEKRLRAVLLFVGGEQFNGRRGWDTTKVKEEDLERSLDDFDTTTDEKGKYIGKYKDTVVESTNESQGNNLNASIEDSEKESAVTIEENNEETVVEAIEETIDDTITEDIEEDSKDEDKEETRKVIVSTSKRGRKKANASIVSSKAEIEALINNVVDDSNTRDYIGVYFDKDISKFLKGIKHGNRSELINKIIRQYLTENGVKI